MCVCVCVLKMIWTLKGNKSDNLEKYSALPSKAVGVDVFKNKWVFSRDISKISLLFY